MESRARLPACFELGLKQPGCCVVLTTASTRRPKGMAATPASDQLILSPEPPPLPSLLPCVHHFTSPPTSDVNKDPLPPPLPPPPQQNTSRSRRGSLACQDTSTHTPADGTIVGTATITAHPCASPYTSLCAPSPPSPPSPSPPRPSPFPCINVSDMIGPGGSVRCTTCHSHFPTFFTPTRCNTPLLVATYRTPGGSGGVNASNTTANS